MLPMLPIKEKNEGITHVYGHRLADVHLAVFSGK